MPPKLPRIALTRSCSDLKSYCPCRMDCSKLACRCGSKSSCAISARFLFKAASTVPFSFSNRFPSCWLFATFSSAPLRAFSMCVTAMPFLACTASISCSLVCAARSSSRMDLLSPSFLLAVSVETPAFSACIDHCSCSIFCCTSPSAAASLSNSSFSFCHAPCFSSTNLRKSCNWPCDFFCPSRCEWSSFSLFFNFDSIDATSLLALETPSSNAFKVCAD
mmetsp:Transcript_33990/g.79504  ORF Transcript_33990/g.79504 Transcript_33990/m.79504 type:complete len:220 (+) Transcript_33990:2278-2937(+)